jgi:predicted DNA-binding protein (UPF0251 family)
MGRPKLPRKGCCKPVCSCFKPEDPNKKGLLGVDLGKDEFAALKLHDVDGLDQKEAAKKMKVSQPTFARILASAHQKLSSAIVAGGEIRIN